MKTRKFFITTSLATAVALAAFQLTTRAQDESEEEARPIAQPRGEMELVDTLEQANLQEAIRILLKGYIKRDKLDTLELNRAAMHGLLDRSGFGVTLVDRKAEEEAGKIEHQLVAEMLSKDIAYLRPGTFSDRELDEIPLELEKFAKADAKTLMLDLRVPANQATFQNAARFLYHFSAPSDVLFKIKRPGEKRPALYISKPTKQRWEKEIVLLIDQQTPPASEAIAAVLRRKSKPIIVGQATPGKTVEYDKVIISDEAYLRFAVAEVVFAEEESIFRKGISPDLESIFAADQKAIVFRDSQNEKGMKPFLFSKQQPRHNEAALVAGTNPELDYAIAKSAGRDTGYDTIPVHDRNVQAAMDYLVTRKFLPKPAEPEEE